MEINEALLNEIVLLRQTLERIATSLEDIDDILEIMFLEDDYEDEEMEDLWNCSIQMPMMWNLAENTTKQTQTDSGWNSGCKNKKPLVLTGGCFVCRVTDSDRGPFNFQSNALPTELTRQRTEILTASGETVKQLVFGSCEGVNLRQEIIL